MSVRDKSSAGHYHWGAGCEGWRLVDTPELSVIEERMPPVTTEKLHYHERAQQYFHVLCGEACFDVDGGGFTVSTGQGMHILPGQRHRIRNPGGRELRFILVSTPSTRGDRIEIQS